MVKPGIYSIYNLSPYHMKPETRKVIEAMAAGGKGIPHLKIIPVRTGEYIIMFKPEDAVRKDMPEDLKRIMKYARDLKIDMLYFDRRADVIHANNLPIYKP